MSISLELEFIRGLDYSVHENREPEPITPISSTRPFGRLLADFTFPTGRDDYCLPTFTRRSWTFTSKQIRVSNALNMNGDRFVVI